jgi:nucleoside-diphosphate-sugar epimerase
MQEFIETNILGTLTLLEGAAASRVTSFVFTSTTSVFGDALRPPPGAPAAWVTENVNPIPRNI